MVTVVDKISSELQLKPSQVQGAVTLLFDEECTVPFVARYRKERTGALDEVQLRSIRDRYHYLSELESSKVKYRKVIEDQGKLTPALAEQLAKCATKQELEDLYLPFKPKRRTRAQIARQQNLEALFTMILEQRASITDLAQVAADFVSEREDVTVTPEQALAGASDIFAEQLSETAEIRAVVRRLSLESGQISAQKIESAKPAAEENKKKKGKKNRANLAKKYENYFEYREPVTNAASHRIMAVRRGEAEKVLKVAIEVDSSRIIEEVKRLAEAGLTPGTAVRPWFDTACEDAYQRLLKPSIETEIRQGLKHRAEQEAIRIFAKNLEQLLMLPPIPHKVVLGVDPGLRTGSKLAVVAETGKLLTCTTIYPDPSKENSEKSQKAKATLAKLLEEHRVDYVAIGNGTGCREITRLISAVIKEKGFQCKRVIVNEAGASVYSADEIARQEFPNLEASLRSAVSIARRLQDPLAELVKIDPRSIGVGQYQHDVNVTKLKQSLDDVVESCVNRVGVNLNTASHKLLSYVSGIGESLAKSMVQFRDQLGKFEARAQILETPGFGPKSYQQAAGFLRVPSAANPLDNSAVHPESYDLVQELVGSANVDLPQLIGQPELIQTLPLEKFVTADIGLLTLQDIAAELAKPGRDPRDEGSRLTYSDDVAELEDLKPGMELKGTVTNVTNFGAFVDVGVHQDGLVHISELSDQFVKEPANHVAVGEILRVRVLDVDLTKRQIKLSCRASDERRTAPKPMRGRAEGHPPRRGDQPREGRGRPHSSQQRSRGRRKPEQHFTLDDLVSKFKKD